MNRKRKQNYLIEYIESLQTQGQYSFSIHQVRATFKHVNKAPLKNALIRLSKKGKIVSVHKGFYVIVTPEYAGKGVLPPEWFIDSLMSYLKKPYYVGLSSAAALYGASHQQPQEFFVITKSPAIRSKVIKGLKINFLVKAKISQTGIEKRKTETGYINVSGAELTAVNIVQFENAIGGLNRVVTILDELLDAIDTRKLQTILRKDIPLAFIQRLGYISEKVLGKEKIANVIKHVVKYRRLSRVPLQAGGKRSGYPVDKDWKIVINAKPESDL